jgi:tripartite-type tricarboxylate transporter receptor subunit TctC
MSARNYSKVLLIALSIAAGAAAAQTYPAKPVRLVVGFPPGGATDVVARLLAEKLSVSLGQQFVVDNRAGAASNIAADYVANAPRDGYTILMGTISLAINPTLYKKLPYDAVRDFAPVSQVTSAPFLLVVHPSLPARNVREFIALAKKMPGQLNYASAGNGSGAHLFAAMFGSMAGIKIAHVPYKGAAPATTAVLSGEAQFMFDNIVTTLPLARAGKFRALAVTTAKRAAAAPELPTVAEAGVPGYDANSWFGVFAPTGTPQPVLDRLHAEIVKTLKQPDVRERLAGLGCEPAGTTPAEFGAFYKSEVAKWGKVVRETGVQID